MRIESPLGDLIFSTGFKTNRTISLLGNEYSIIIKACAYFEEDGITSKQVQAFSHFISNETELLRQTEKSLKSFAGESFSDRFIPRTLLFERDGSYALLLDDSEDPDDGIAVVLSPTQMVVSQNDYL